MNDNKHVISKVIEGSLLDKKGVLPGDSLIRINGNIIEDVFDYRFMILENHLEFELSRNDEVYSVIIDKDDDSEKALLIISHCKEPVSWASSINKSGNRF